MKPTLTILLLLLTAAPALAQVQALTAWWIDTGETDSTGLGPYFAPLGDINGDGLADFAEWVVMHEIYVYLGNTQPDTIPDIIIHSPDPSFGWFGYGLFSVGDVNEDGFPDFIAGASVNDYNGPRHAYLYFGGAAFDTLPDVHIVGPTITYSTFARNGAELGDINGDGYNDFALSDYECNKIYLYYGGNPPDSIPDVIIHADSVLNRIGWLIAPLGDVNNDGYADFVMSDDECEFPGISGHAGVVAIYYGGNPPDTLPVFYTHGTANAHLGVSLTTLDWNGDGQLDIFAGNSTFYAPGYHGSVWEYNVSPAMTGQPDHVFLAESDEVLGSHLWHVDLNGDGRQDLVDGEPWYAYSGKVYVFLTAPYSDTLFDATYYQGDYWALLGQGAYVVGDINGDGIEDLAISEAYFGYGRLHLILGNASLHQSGIELLPRPALPQTAALLEACPNPFNSQVVLKITTSSSKDNILQIYNLKGEEVRRFSLNLGQQQVIWDGKSASGLPCASGIYLAKLTGPTYQATQKLVLLK